MSGPGGDALSDGPVCHSSSSLFTCGKMAGKGNNLASPPYFCKVSLDARGTGETALGELWKYKEGWSLSTWKHLSSSLGKPMEYPQTVGTG
jgi:hypothetical protein